MKYKIARDITLSQAMVLGINLFFLLWGTNEHPHFWWWVLLNVIIIGALVFTAIVLQDAYIDDHEREKENRRIDWTWDKAQARNETSKGSMDPNWTSILTR